MSYIPHENNLAKLILDVAYTKLVIPKLSTTEQWFKLDSWFSDNLSKRTSDAVKALSVSMGFNDRAAGDLILDYNKISIAGSIDLDPGCDRIKPADLIEFVLTSELVSLNLRRIILSTMGDHSTNLQLRAIYKMVFWFTEEFDLCQDAVEFMWREGFNKFEYGCGAGQTTEAGIRAGIFRFCNGDDSIVVLQPEKIQKTLNADTHSLERLFVNSETHQNWSRFSSYCHVIKDITIELRCNTSDKTFNKISALRGRYSGSASMLHEVITVKLSEVGSGPIPKNAIISFSGIIDEFYRYIIGSTVDDTVMLMANIYIGLLELFISADSIDKTSNISMELTTAMRNHSFYDPATGKMLIEEFNVWLGNKQDRINCEALYA